MRPLQRQALDDPVSCQSNSDVPVMGVITLGHIEGAPGTASHRASFPWPTLWHSLTGTHLVSDALTASPRLYPQVLELAKDLVDQGADCILTTCGYFTPYQTDLVRDLPVPVLTSSLMQLPALLAMAGTKRVLVVAANAKAVDDRCLSMAGVSDQRRVSILGLEGPGAFREQVLEAGGLHDVPAIIRQASVAVDAAVTHDRDIAAVLLECGDLCLAAPGLRSRPGPPVYDYLTGAASLYASVAPAGIGYT